MLDNDINETEYVLLLSMYYKNIDEDIPTLIKRYAEKWGIINETGKPQMFPDDIKERLVNKNLLHFTGKYELTNKFLDLFVNELIAGNELIDNYPVFIIINNVKIPLKTSNRIELRNKYRDWETDRKSVV